MNKDQINALKLVLSHYKDDPRVQCLYSLLDAPECEPVGEVVAEDIGASFYDIQIGAHFYNEAPEIGTKLYTHPQPSKMPELLTDSEIISMAYDCNALPECVTDKTLFAYARAIEAAVIERMK